MKQGRKKKPMEAILVGICTSVMITLMLSVLCSIAISSEWIPQKASGSLGWICAIVALMIGCWFAVKWGSGRKVPSVLLVYVGYGALCVVGKLIFYPGTELCLSWCTLFLPLSALLAAVLANRRYRKRR